MRAWCSERIDKLRAHEEYPQGQHTPARAFEVEVMLTLSHGISFW